WRHPPGVPMIGPMTDPSSSLPEADPHEFLSPGASGSRGTSPDIGTPTSRIVALVVVTLLYLVIAGAQNLSGYLAPAENQLGRDPRGGEFAKLMFLIEEALGGGKAGGQLAEASLTQFEASSHPADRLQGVLVLGESKDPARALRLLETIRSNLGPAANTEAGEGSLGSGGSPRRTDWALVRAPDDPETGAKPDEEFVVDQEVIHDAEAMETLYTLGLDALSDDARERLVERYGWLGRLATTPETDTQARDELYADIPWAIAFLVFAGGMFLVWGVAGLTMFIVAIVMMATGRLPFRFERPRVGGSVFLETLGVFLLGFGLVQVGGALVGKSNPQIAGVVGMLGQWLLILTLFWPLLRGVKVVEWCGAVGWTAPRGVFREIVAGIAGYFAGVPLFVAGAVMTVVLTFLSAKIFGEPTEPPSNPILEIVRSADLLMLVLLISLATIWAPIVEETLFRGALYRHLRGRVGFFVAALSTALLFAYLHSYGPLMVGPLIALGFTFAMIREWRGSLIGSITAHCLHNSAIMVLMLLAMKAMA
ncbi:MAG: type II CAAX endopeptidase family protein, partial [Planctomycetota bacterium]|nr:type II CAAX endopeptidase family protein [Planctomycetota bacterium]